MLRARGDAGPQRLDPLGTHGVPIGVARGRSSGEDARLKVQTVGTRTEARSSWAPDRSGQSRTVARPNRLKAWRDGADDSLMPPEPTEQRLSRLWRTQADRESRSPPLGPGRGLPWLVYGVMGAMLAGYVVVLVLRPVGQESTLVDGWGVGVFELAASALCVVGGRRRRPRSVVPMVLGLGLAGGASGILFSRSNLSAATMCRHRPRPISSI